MLTAVVDRGRSGQRRRGWRGGEGEAVVEQQSPLWKGREGVTDLVEEVSVKFKFNSRLCFINNTVEGKCQLLSQG